MIKFKRPMLAAPLMPDDVEHTDDNIFAAMQKLRMPVAATLKKDGVRGIRLDNLYSRTLKKIPNRSIRKASIILPAGFDMELWNKELSYNEIQSIVMSHDHPDSHKIQFHVLDWARDDILNSGYYQRMGLLGSIMHNFDSTLVKFSPPTVCENAEQLMTYFKFCEQEAGEGICFRLLNSPYKQGRSTLQEQYLVKLARHVYREASITGFTEQMENGNIDKRNPVGMMNRSSCVDNLVGKDTLGALVVRDLETGVEFAIGTGFTDWLRKHIWTHQSDYRGTVLKYKCKPFGVKIKPRSPVFVGFRKMEIDG